MQFRQGTGWQVVRNAWTLLASILESTVGYGYLPTNPARGIKFPPKPLKRRPAVIAGEGFVDSNGLEFASAGDPATSVDRSVHEG